MTYEKRFDRQMKRRSDRFSKNRIFTPHFKIRCIQRNIDIDIVFDIIRNGEKRELSSKYNSTTTVIVTFYYLHQILIVERKFIKTKLLDNEEEVMKKRSEFVTIIPNVSEENFKSRSTWFPKGNDY